MAAKEGVHGAALHMRLQWSAVFFSAREAEAEGGAAPRASLYLKGLTAYILAIPGEVACEPHCSIEEKAMPADQPKTGGKQLGG